MSEPIFFWRYRRRGGLRFLRIGRLQFSFCIIRAWEDFGS